MLRGSLWDDVKKRFFSAFIEEQERKLAEPREPSLAYLAASLVEYFRFLQSRPSFARLTCWMRLEGDDSCVEMDKKVVQLATERVKLGQKAGYIRSDLRPENVVITLLALVENWFVSRHHYLQAHYADETFDEKGPDECYLNDVVKIFLEGIKGPNGEVP